MSAIKGGGKTCLLCFQVSKTNGSENKKLSYPMFVEFLLKNALDIPNSYCDTLLATKGNPSDWIYCCTTCSKIINDLKKVSTELEVIQRKYDLLKQKVKSTLEFSNPVNPKSRKEAPAEIYIQTAKEIRHYIFAEAQDGEQNEESIKIEPDALLEVKYETSENFSFEDETSENFSFEDETKPVADFGDDSPKSFSRGGETDDYISKKEDVASVSRMIDKPHGLKTVKKATGNTKIVEGQDDASSNKIDFDDFDSDCETASEYEKETEEEPPKKKRKSRSIIFCCTLCDSFFMCAEHLNLHYSEVHEKNYKCSHCESLFANVIEGLEHYKSIHPTEIPKLHKSILTQTEGRNCKFCGQFLKVGTVVQHMNEFHKIPQCEFCKEVFPNRKKLSNHRRAVHFKELKLEPLQCQICKKSFKSPIYLKYHMSAKHTHDFKFMCDICGTKVRTQNLLDKHVRRLHNRSKDFVCKFCEKRFFLKVEVDLHEARMHTKQFKIHCTICSKGFVFKSNLDQHMLIYHSNAPKPIVCELCNASFNVTNALKTHQRGHHYKELNLEPFKCKDCGKILACPTSLKTHIIRQHTKEYKFKCNECGNPYLTQKTMDKHIRHQHKKEPECLCTECGKTYFSKNSLKSHIERYHTKEFTHKCTICPDKGYSDTWGLNRHMKIKHPNVTM